MLIEPNLRGLNLTSRSMLLFAVVAVAAGVQRVFMTKLRTTLIMTLPCKECKEIAGGITTTRKVGKVYGKTQQLENLRGLLEGVKEIQHKRNSMELPRGIETVLEGLKKE